MGRKADISSSPSSTGVAVIVLMTNTLTINIPMIILPTSRCWKGQSSENIARAALATKRDRKLVTWMRLAECEELNFGKVATPDRGAFAWM